MEARIAVLEHIAKTTSAVLERMEQRQDQFLDRTNRRVDTLNNHFLWLVALQVATTGGLLMAMARGFHWL